MAETEELVSVIMPAYNAEKFIAASIESVIAQTYQNWELIIGDDASTDNTTAIIKTFCAKDSRIKFFRNKENEKQGKTRNRAIEISKGSLIAFLDADDIWYSEKLSTQVKEIRKHDVDLIFSDADVLEDGKIIKNRWTPEPRIYHGKESVKLFLRNNKIPLLTVLAKKNALQSAGGFTESNEPQYSEDYSLWMRMLAKGFRFLGMSQSLARYNKHKDQSTKNKNILHVLRAIRSLEIDDEEISRLKNESIKFWIYRYLMHRRFSRADETKKVISFYPDETKKKLYNFILNFFGPTVLYLVYRNFK